MWSEHEIKILTAALIARATPWSHGWITYPLPPAAVCTLQADIIMACVRLHVRYMYLLPFVVVDKLQQRICKNRNNKKNPKGWFWHRRPDTRTKSIGQTGDTWTSDGHRPELRRCSLIRVATVCILVLPCHWYIYRKYCSYYIWKYGLFTKNMLSGICI